jgi:hypothetical protein
MELLSIFNTGGVTLALTLFWLGSGGWFFYNANKQHNSEYGYYNPQPPGGWIKLGDKTPWTHIPEVLYISIITVLYLIAMIFVAIDYKGV